MNPLDDGGQCLAVEALARAKRIADRYSRLFPEHEQDIGSAANFAAVRAAATFEPDRGQVWWRWSKMCIDSEVRRFLDSTYLKKRTLWDCEELEAIPCRAEKLDGDDAVDPLYELTANIPEVYREICDLVYKVGLTPRQAGTRLGYSENYGCKLHRKAIEYLRESHAA